MSRCKHEPGIIHTWTFDQTEKWIDVHGFEHAIKLIDRDYALDILIFLLYNAERFRRVHAHQHGEVVPEWGLSGAFEWMESKPIVSALRERILAAS